jgi:hypothetical protein
MSLAIGAISLVDLLFSERQSVFAVLDGARDPRVYELVVQSKLSHASLFEGNDGQFLEKVAPYIVELPREAPLWAELLAAWGQSWGIYLNAPTTMQELRENIRTHLKMRAPNGAEFYFRFYDPRVLRGFLPACTAEECAEFFGPVSRFVTEAEDPGFAAEFRRTAALAAQRLVAISRPGADPTT